MFPRAGAHVGPHGLSDRRQLFVYRRHDLVRRRRRIQLHLALAEDNKLAVRSLAALEEKLRARGLNPVFLTGHTGWTDNFAFAFAHKEQLCSPFGKRVHDPNAPYDAYDESDDTEQSAKSGLLQGVGR